MLAKKGLSTREIAKITGWAQRTIARDLEPPPKPPEPNGSESEPNGSATHRALTGSPETIAHREAVAEEAAAEGVTDEPVEKYRISYWWRGRDVKPSTASLSPAPWSD